MDAEAEVNIMNTHMVSVSGRGIHIMNPPRAAMDRQEALVLAAWIVAIADENDEFPSILEKVKDT